MARIPRFRPLTSRSAKASARLNSFSSLDREASPLITRRERRPVPNLYSRTADACAESASLMGTMKNRPVPLLIDTLTGPLAIRKPRREYDAIALAKQGENQEGEG